MSSAYSVDYEELSKVAAQLQSAAEQIEQLIKQTQTQVDGELATFTGSTRAQFDTMFTQWSNANITNANAMIEYAANVAKAAGQYAEAQQIAGDLLR